MTVTVRVPMALRKLTGGAAEVEAQAATVRDLIENLEKSYSGLKNALCEEDGKVRGYVNIYINDENFRSMNGIETSLKEGDEVAIVPAIAGGAEPFCSDE